MGVREEIAKLGANASMEQVANVLNDYSNNLDLRISQVMMERSKKPPGIGLQEPPNLQVAPSMATATPAPDPARHTATGERTVLPTGTDDTPVFGRQVESEPPVDIYSNLYNQTPPPIEPPPEPSVAPSPTDVTTTAQDPGVAPPEIAPASEEGVRHMEKRALEGEVGEEKLTAEAVRKEKGNLWKAVQSEMSEKIGRNVDPVQAAYLYMGEEPPSTEKLALAKIGRAGPALSRSVKYGAKKLFGDAPEYRTEEERLGHEFYKTVEKIKWEREDAKIKDRGAVKDRELQIDELQRQSEEGVDFSEAQPEAVRAEIDPELQKKLDREIAKGREQIGGLSPEEVEAVKNTPWFASFAKEMVYMTLDDGLYWLLGFGGLKGVKNIAKSAVKHGSSSKQAQRAIDAFKNSKQAEIARYWGVDKAVKGTGKAVKEAGKVAGETGVFLAPESAREMEAPSGETIALTAGMVKGIPMAGKGIKKGVKQIAGSEVTGKVKGAIGKLADHRRVQKTRDYIGSLVTLAEQAAAKHGAKSKIAQEALEKVREVTKAAPETVTKKGEGVDHKFTSMTDASGKKQKVKYSAVQDGTAVHLYTDAGEHIGRVSFDGSGKAVPEIYSKYQNTKASKILTSKKVLREIDKKKSVEKAAKHEQHMAEYRAKLDAEEAAKAEAAKAEAAKAEAAKAEAAKAEAAKAEAAKAKAPEPVAPIEPAKPLTKESLVAGEKPTPANTKDLAWDDVDNLIDKYGDHVYDTKTNKVPSKGQEAQLDALVDLYYDKKIGKSIVDFSKRDKKQIEAVREKSSTSIKDDLEHVLETLDDTGAKTWEEAMSKKHGWGAPDKPAATPKAKTPEPAPKKTTKEVASEIKEEVGRLKEADLSVKIKRKGDQYSVKIENDNYFTGTADEVVQHIRAWKPEQPKKAFKSKKLEKEYQAETTPKEAPHTKAELAEMRENAKKISGLWKKEKPKYYTKEEVLTNYGSMSEVTKATQAELSKTKHVQALKDMGRKRKAKEEYKAKVQEEVIKQMREGGYTIKPKRRGISLDEQKAKTQMLKQEDEALNVAHIVQPERYAGVKAKDLPDKFEFGGQWYRKVKQRDPMPGQILVENTNRNKFYFKPDQRVSVDAQSLMEPLVKLTKKKKPSLEDFEGLMGKMGGSVDDHLTYMHTLGGLTPKNLKVLKSSAQQLKETVAEWVDNAFLSKSRVPKDIGEAYKSHVLMKQTKLFEMAEVINKLETTLTKENPVFKGWKHSDKSLRELVPFVIEETSKSKVKNAIRKMGRDDLLKKIEELTPEQQSQLRKAAHIAGKHFKSNWEYMKNNLDDFTAEEIENYVTHIWDFPDKKTLKGFTGGFSTHNPLLKKRYIKTIEEGIVKHDLKPKTLDIAEIVKIHDDHVIRSTENKAFLKTLMKFTGPDGQKYIVPKGKAPSNWIMAQHPLLQKVITKKVHVSEGGKTIIQKQPQAVAYHPDLKPIIDVLFGPKKFLPQHMQSWIKPLHTLNALQKKLQLSASLFHHFALGETAIPTLRFKELPNLARTANPFGKDARRAVFNKEYKLFGARKKLARDGVAHGLQLGASSDVMKSTFDNMLKGAEDKLDDLGMTAWGKGANVLRGLNEHWDRALWDYYHNDLKLMAYESLVSRHIGKTGDSMQLMVKKKREIASMVNDTFGGQNWELLMTNPQTLALSQGLLLSPDWLKSTIKQALSPTGIGAMYKETKGLRRKMGAQFWAKAGIYFYGGMNLLNATLVMDDEVERTGKSWKEVAKNFKENPLKYTMMGNDPWHESHLHIGRFDDGQKMYLRWGKQFRELIEFLYMPADVWYAPSVLQASTKKIGGKASPMLQSFSQLFTGKTMSGFETRKDPLGAGLGNGFVKLIANTFVPFTLQQALDENKEWTLTDLAMPKSKGMGYTKTKEIMMQSMMAGRSDFFDKVYRAALDNDLPAAQIAQNARGQLVQEIMHKEYQEWKRKYGDDAPKTFAEAVSSAKMTKKDVIRASQIEMLAGAHKLSTLAYGGFAKWYVEMIEKKRTAEEMKKSGLTKEEVDEAVEEFMKAYNVPWKSIDGMYDEMKSYVDSVDFDGIKKPNMYDKAVSAIDWTKKAVFGDNSMLKLKDSNGK